MVILLDVLAMMQGSCFVFYRRARAGEDITLRIQR